MTTPVAPPASYPGTVAAFTTKADGQIIYGAHANQWQNEITATEKTLGVNPQTSAPLPPATSQALTVSGRISNVESSAVWASGGSQVIHGAKEFADPTTFDANVLAKGVLDHRPVSTGAGYRTYTDGSGVQAYNTAGGTIDLLTQPVGGILRRHGYPVWDAGNDGPGSGLDADTLDGYHATDFLIKQGCQIGMSADQTVTPLTTNGNPFATRFVLNLTTVTWEHLLGDGAQLFHSTGTYGPYFSIPTSGLWIINVNTAWTGPWSGARSFAVRNNAYPAGSTNAGVITYFARSELLGIGPPAWPDPSTYTGGGNFTSTTIFPTLVSATEVRYLPAGTQFRVEVQNWNDVGINATVRSNTNTQLHQSTSVTIAQVV